MAALAVTADAGIQRRRRTHGLKYEFRSEDIEWWSLTPAQRLCESEKLWETYLALGGSLDPEPDTQSPFHAPEASGSGAAHGRAGVHCLRRRRVQSRR